MCGICGVYNYGNRDVPADEALLCRMRDTMVHRGPDDAGVWISADRRVGLGHRRLSIVDLSPAGHQPMANEDGTVWIVYNGESYNHVALRPGLEAKGHRYRSHSDTETLIHLYEDKGPDLVHDLMGMCGAAIWDEKRQRLLLIRDRLGIKPVYYTVANGRLIFASEIKAILAHPAVTADVDPAALFHYFSFLNTPVPETLFQGIRKLPAGTYLTCDAGGCIETHRYWNPANARIEQAAPEEYAERIRALLTDAVRQRMMSDVPVGAFLSGGIDSSTNVALMAQLTNQPVNTFSITFEGFGPEQNFHDMPFARQIAAQFKTNHNELVINSRDFLDYLPQLIHHTDEPVSDPACIPLHFISDRTKELGVTVVLVGEGSDECWCGYPDYVRVLEIFEGKWGKLMQLPRPLRALLYRAQCLATQDLGRRDLFRRAASDDGLFWGLEVGFWDEEKAALFVKDFPARYAPAPSGDIVSGFMDEFRHLQPDADYLARMTYLELSNRLPELLLMRVDKVTMGSSLEARVPFLDYRLVELGLNLPAGVKIPGHRPKHLLKQALKGIIPDNILARPKQGFRVPFPEWFRHELADRITDYLMGSPLRERGFFDYEHIQSLIDDHRAGRADYSYKLWPLINVTGWYDHWVAGSGRTL